MNEQNNVTTFDRKKVEQIAKKVKEGNKNVAKALPLWQQDLINFWIKNNFI